MVSRRSFFTLFAGAVPAAALAKNEPPQKQLRIEDDGAVFTVDYNKTKGKWRISGKGKDDQGTLELG